MTLEQFADVFAILAVQLRATDADEATIKSYYVALKDLELELIQMAAERLGKTAEWFPKTSDWREMAATIERDRVEAQRALLQKLPAPLCLACEDTGWERLPDGRVKRCGCASQRRHEVLGRRPWPALPEAS